MGAIFGLLHAILDIAFFVIIAQAIMSWLLAFGVINLGNNGVARVWDVLTRLTEPLYGKIRSFLPSFNGIDLSPLVALLGIMVLRAIIPGVSLLN